MTFHESNNKNLLRRLVTGVLYTGIEQADTGQLDANGQPVNNPAADLEPGHIWVRVGDPERSAVVAWNGKINSQITNIPVYVGINRLTRGLEVIDLDLPRASQRFGSAVSSLYAQPSGDLSTTTTRGRNFKPGRVYVSSGLTVLAYPFFYKDTADAIKYWDGTGTLTLAAPAASGGVDTVRWTIVALNPDATTPALVAITGTEQLVTLPILQIEDLAALAITDGYYPLAAAKLTTGDTSVPEANWIDFRLYFEKDGTVSGMTSFTVAADSGSSQTISNGNTLTIAGGTNLNSVASATDTVTLNLDTAPTISDFTNMAHDHADADDGGQLTDAALSAAVGIAKGGTGQTTATAAFDALAPTTTKGDVIAHNGTDNIRVAVGSNGRVLIADSAETPGLRWGRDPSLTTFGMVVKNTSGATVAAGDVGIVIYDATYGRVYNRTTTANYPDVGSIAVVLIGGADAADIYVAQRGRVTLNYTGTAPNAGQWLTTSTTGGSAQRSTTMRPEIFAVAEATGSGGTVQVQLYTQTQFVPFSSTNNLHQVLSASDLDFVATINGAPSATSVVYNAPSSGAENVINVGSSSELAKLVLWNSTRSTGRLISSVNTGTNTITTVSSTDAWASTDSITIRSQTNTDTVGTSRFCELDLSQTTEIPLLARALVVFIIVADSGGAGENAILHPYEAGAASKRRTKTTQTAQNIDGEYHLPLYDRRFTYLHTATGAGTFDSTLRVMGYFLAVP